MKTKNISRLLLTGVILNSLNLNSFASILSEDGRYETFEGNNITLDNILEEDKVDVEIEGDTIVNVANQKDSVPITKSYTVEGTNHIPLQGEYDSKARPVIKGNTLVNIATGRLKVSKIGDYGAIHYSTEMLKTDISTVYTVVVKNLPSDTRWCLTTHDQSTTYINYNIDNVAKFNSRTSYPSTISFIFNNDNIIWTEDILNNLEIMIIEGDLASNPPIEYFEGLKSSFEDQLVTQDMVDSGQEKPENLGKYKVEYKITGKNKINGIWKIAHDVNGVEYPENKDIAKSVDFIKVQPGTTYTLSKSEDAPSNYRLERINFYKNGRYISHSWNKTFKVPSDCNEIKVLICNTEGNNFNEIVLSDIPNFQLEEGSTATKYESYKESIKTFYLNTPLLEGDTIEDIDGKATHVKRYSRLIIDGSDDEDWFLNTPYSKGGQYVSYRSVFGIRPKSNSIIYCDKLKYIGEYNGVNDCIWAYNNASLVIQNSTIGTIEEFNQWLLESPITVVYPLAEPIYETISEESILCDYYVNGHLDLNTNIPVNKVDFMSTTTNLNYLYPSAEYTVQFESDNIGKVDTVSLGGETLYSNYTVNQGINRFNITTPNNITSTELVLDGIGFNLSNLVITQATDESFDYFEGLKSVGQDDESGHKIEVTSNNKNLFDINDSLELGYLNVKTGEIALKDRSESIIKTNEGFSVVVKSMYGGCVSDFIRVSPKKEYKWIFKKDGSFAEQINIAFYDKNKNIIESGESDTRLFRKMIIPSNVYYVRVGFWLYEPNTISYEKLMLMEYNNNDTEYVPYQSNKIEISLTEPLRSLPNGVKDRIIKRNGQWVVERNCGELSTEMLYNAKWNLHIKDNNSMDHFGAVFNNVNGKIVQDINLYSNIMASGYWASQVPYTICTSSTIAFQIGINVEKGTYTEDRLKKYIKENNMRVVYQLATPIYEPLHINSTINTYLDITHISNNSNIPANMKVTVDRTINRATEAVELAKTNPTISNISKARMWTNLLKESINKDELHNEINSIANIEDLQLEKKASSANVDVYIKSENMLLMSLTTNSITFNDYSGVEDMELSNAINISINSSLPYQLNSYLLSEIENGDKSNRIEKDLLNIKVNKGNDYKTFNDINEKLVLEDDCDAGNNKSHSIDLRLKGSQAHKADIYKTVIKFEAEQK